MVNPRPLRFITGSIFLFTVFIISFSSSAARETRSAPLTDWSYIQGAKLKALQNQDLSPPEFWKINTADWQNFSPATTRPRLKPDRGGRLWLRVKLPDFPRDPGFKEPGLHIPYIHQTFEVFTSEENSGNKRLYKFGELKRPGEPVFNGWPAHFIPLDSSHSGRYLYFRIYSDSKRIGILTPARLLPHSHLLLEIIRSDLDRLILSALSLFIGGFAFFIFILRRRDKNIYLFFSLFTLWVGIYLISNRTVQIQNLLWNAPGFWWFLEFLALYLFPAWLSAFINQIIPRRILGYIWKIHLFYGLFGLLGYFSGILPFYKSMSMFFNITLVSCVYVLGLVGLEAFRGNREARILLTGLFVFVVFAFYDLLGVLGYIYWARQTLAWGMFFFLIFLGIILIRRYREVREQMLAYSRKLEVAQKDLKDHAENLEVKVTERTKELSDSLMKIKDLKETQDADYFLTSLLMEPFIRQDTSDSRFKVDMLVRQKKSFVHNKRQVELGGDICNIQPLTLGDKTYLAFLNGDAMGKSMQGAGGAIVLGVIYESLIHRELAADQSEFNSPTEWLTHCIQELQYAFLRFHGTMLASMILGLLDEQTGLVYYINAEHPPPALYRNKKAHFIDKESIFPKLGVSGAPGDIGINTLQLTPGDKLLFGSDGRDDIQTGLNDMGVRIINTDENAFLKFVEVAEGRLDRIEAEIKTSGEFTDDLSLICIHYPL